LQAIEISWAGVGEGRVLAREFLAENQARRVVCQLPAMDLRMVDLVCRFDHLFHLGAPDVRRAASLFYGVEVDIGTGWRYASLPGAETRKPIPLYANLVK
jgi:hypothetical protein